MRNFSGIRGRGRRRGIRVSEIRTDLIRIEGHMEALLDMIVSEAREVLDQDESDPEELASLRYDFGVVYDNLVESLTQLSGSSAHEIERRLISGR